MVISRRTVRGTDWRIRETDENEMLVSAMECTVMEYKHRVFRIGSEIKGWALRGEGGAAAP